MTATERWERLNTAFPILKEIGYEARLAIFDNMVEHGVEEFKRGVDGGISICKDVYNPNK